MIIDKTIAACNVCSNSWFAKEKNGKLILPKKCPVCSSPNWNKKAIRYEKTASISVYKNGVVLKDGTHTKFLVGEKRKK